MLAHNVYFTLKDASPEKQQELISACKKYLSQHPGMVFFACGGREESLAREVNDKTFHVALHCFFASQADHDAYQEASSHHQFIAEQKENWATVRVFDSVVEKE